MPAITTTSGIDSTIKIALSVLRRPLCAGFVNSTSDAAGSRSLINKTQN